MYESPEMTVSSATIADGNQRPGEIARVLIQSAFEGPSGSAEITLRLRSNRDRAGSATGNYRERRASERIVQATKRSRFARPNGSAEINTAFK